jgi:hypothetical protein
VIVKPIKAIVEIAGSIVTHGFEAAHKRLHEEQHRIKCIKISPFLNGDILLQ